MATHSSILGWKIPWIEEPGRVHGVASVRQGSATEPSLTRSQCDNTQ